MENIEEIKIDVDEMYMREALKEAKQCGLLDEVPIGAIIVRNGEIIARSGNRKERDNCAVHHAEIMVIEQAARLLGNWYLDECELFVTLEPCVMCAGAIINSRLKRVCFGAYDKKAGGFGGLYDFNLDGKLNHKPLVRGGVLQEECGVILSEFFKGKRKKQ